MKIYDDFQMTGIEKEQKKTKAEQQIITITINGCRIRGLSTAKSDNFGHFSLRISI